VKRPIFILLAIGALVSAQPVSAAEGSGSPSDRSAQISQLESRAAQLTEKLSRTGAPQARGDAALVIQKQRIREQRRRIQDLLERARAGQQIDPAEIDRVR